MRLHKFMRKIANFPNTTTNFVYYADICGIIIFYARKPMTNALGILNMLIEQTVVLSSKCI